MTSTKDSPRKTKVKEIVSDLKEYGTKMDMHIAYESFGKDKNKPLKSGESTSRGGKSSAARHCSMHLRTIYPQYILQDNNKSEFCVKSRHKKNCCIFKSECSLCFINEYNDYISTQCINFSEEILNKVQGNSNPNGKNKRLLAHMFYHIFKDYPVTDSEETKKGTDKYTILRITINDDINEAIEYFIKISAFSSMLKTSAPTGYKYKDRIEIGSVIHIRSNKYKNLIFCIEKDQNKYIDPKTEGRRPVVNGVGFWNLLKNGGIRNIIHLNEDQCINVIFKCLIKKNDTNINKIKIELVCNRHSIKNDIVKLYEYNRPQNIYPIQMRQKQSLKIWENEIKETNNNINFDKQQQMIPFRNINNNNYQQNQSNRSAVISPYNPISYQNNVFYQPQILSNTLNVPYTSNTSNVAYQNNNNSPNILNVSYTSNAMNISNKSNPINYNNISDESSCYKYQNISDSMDPLIMNYDSKYNDNMLYNNDEDIDLQSDQYNNTPIPIPSTSYNFNYSTTPSDMSFNEVNINEFGIGFNNNLNNNFDDNMLFQNESNMFSLNEPPSKKQKMG